MAHYGIGKIDEFPKYAKSIEDISSIYLHCSLESIDLMHSRLSYEDLVSYFDIFLGTQRTVNQSEEMVLGRFLKILSPFFKCIQAPIHRIFKVSCRFF